MDNNILIAAKCTFDYYYFDGYRVNIHTYWYCYDAGYKKNFSKEFSPATGSSNYVEWLNYQTFIDAADGEGYELNPQKRTINSIKKDNSLKIYIFCNHLLNVQKILQ